MKLLSKTFLAVTLSLLLIFTCLPTAALAATGTLNSEKPEITASYTDSLGNVVDGNALEAGTYNMTISLEGMQSLSEMELTAAYDPDVVSFANSYSLLSDDNSEMESMGEIIADGNFVIGFVSVNEDCTAVNTDGTKLISVDVTITSDTAVDMDETLAVSSNPDFTFLEADYGDIREVDSSKVYDCYGLEKTDAYSGEVYSMTCDLSPEIPHSFSVTGTIVAMTNPISSDSTVGTNGVADVDIVINGETVATTDSTGAYSFEIANGSYDVTLSYAYGVARTVKLIVDNAPVEAPAITIVMCDYDKNGTINISDVSAYKSAVASRDSVRADLNRDGVINVSDTTILKAFFIKSNINDIYSEIVIQ